MKHRRSKIFAAGGVLLISVIFTYISGFWISEESRNWQTDSEDLVWGRVIQMEYGIENRGAFLGRFPGLQEIGELRQQFLQERPPEGEFIPYKHQSGLQGTAFGWVNKLLKPFVHSPERRQKLLWFGNSVLFIVCMISLSIWIYREMGFLPACFSFSAVFLSQCSTMTMANLYWVSWTMLLPILAAAAACERYQKEQKFPWGWVVVVSAAVLLRCLCGFEFVSTVMVASEIPVLFKLIKAEKSERKRWCQLAVWIGAGEMAAFAVAMGLWVGQEAFYWGNWSALYHDILETIAKRTGFLKHQVDIAPVYQESLQANRFQVVWEYFTIKVFMLKYSIIQLWEAGAVSTLIVTALAYHNKNKTAVVSCMRNFFLAIVSSLAPISWYYLASAHSYIHTNINSILWLFPCLPLVLALIGANLALIDSILGEGKCTRSTTRS